jgi:acyl-CoA hydrolase
MVRPHAEPGIAEITPIGSLIEMADESKPRRAADSRSELIRWMSIQDANSAGFVHGGVVMRMCDEAAGIAAIRHCGMRAVTAGMDRMTFTEPVMVGELLRCQATVNAVWRTSMEVGVRVDAENAVTGEVRHTSTAYLAMVAVDGEGRPKPVPSLIVDGATEERRQREAETRRRNRLAERDEILAHRKGEGEAKA